MSCKLSVRVDYGIRALAEISLAGDRGTTGSAVADRSKIPKPYLKQILAALVKNGFVESTRGPQGKYKLLRHPSEIRLSQIIESLEGPMSLADPSMTAGPEMRAIFERLTQAVNDALARVTLEECLRAIEKDRGGQPIMFYI